MKGAKLLAAGIVALMGFSYLIITGLRESSSYYMRVGELLSSPASGRVKVEGEVVEGSVSRGERLRFEITDGERRLMVIYGGAEVPPNFREGRPVVVEGRYEPGRGIFVADRIMTKCPSKYEGKR